MVNNIWKFIVDPGLPVTMPAGARILSAAAQNERICIWALVDPAACSMPRKVRVYGTGHSVPSEPGRFLGTALLQGGALVMHVFDAEDPAHV